MTPAVLEYVRKLSAADAKSLSQKALKTAEEVGELAKKVLPYDGAASTTHRFIEKEGILEETVDVILCALSIAYNLGFTDEEIAEKMMDKAQYWEHLQVRESKAVYPLPYEMHVTVSAGVEGIDLDAFKATCGDLGVKPLLIDMHNRAGKTVMLDCQTSSVHMGDNRSALTEVRRVTAGLSEAGFHVVREKIETVPWHPAAPVEADRTYGKHGVSSAPKMPPNCYFEAHFNLLCRDADMSELRMVVEGQGAHLSRNAFKKVSDTETIMMATLRHYEGTFEHFKRRCEIVADHFRDRGYEVPKTITEFSIFDTKVSHDSVWLEAA